MIRSHATRSRCVSTALAAATLAASGSAQLGSIDQPRPGGQLIDPAVDRPPTLGDYAELDNVEGAWINLGHAPVRPIVFGPAPDEFWVVNTHDSTLERFVGLTGAPADVFGVPWTPVSVALHQGDPIVVSRGTYGLTRVDPASGRIKAFVSLPDEPGDLLIVGDKAYVSCTGADAVVEVDLLAHAVTNRWSEQSHPSFRLKSPLFLSLDESGPSERILVAPLTSGNNSTAQGGEGPTTGMSLVVDLELEPPDTRLPDEDLFAIDPVAGTVEVLLERSGTILFGHGVNPADGRFWQLNTDANNKDALAQSEPEVNGVFVRNRITIVEGLFTGGTPIVDSRSLDPGGLAGSITAANTVGQPYTLVFDQSGNAYVAGLLTDNVVVLDQSGGYVSEIDLPPGSIPRGLVLDASEQWLLIQCWGTNEVRAYSAAAPHLLRKVYHLNYDPTPAPVAAGREVFFDASFSLDQNLSCASCHIDGRSDQVAWNLSNAPPDDKGPMVTQTLAGIEKLAPFHWRGERQLADFLPAFTGLLGSSAEPTAQQFADFEAFVFSIQNPANPAQDRRRVLNSSIDPPLTPPSALLDPSLPDAVVGHDIYRNELIFPAAGPQFTCNVCHAMPTGTSNDIHMDFFQGPRPRRNLFKVTPFHELWRKQQSLVTLSNMPTENGTIEVRRGFLGIGFGHTGKVPDLFNFVNAVNSEPIQREHVMAFVHQWDQGLAPAVHYAFLLDQGSAGKGPGKANQELKKYLLVEAAERDCDVAVIGNVDTGDATLAVRWFWNRHTGLFESDRGGLPPRTLQTFLDNALDPALDETNLFVGLPVGMSERFAVDYDLDGVRNTPDSSPYVVGPLFASDSDFPGFDIAPTVRWVTTKAARLYWEADELSTALVEYRELGSGAAWTPITLPTPARAHSVILNDLRPSTLTPHDLAEYGSEDVFYEWVVTLTDLAGNSTPMVGADFRSDYFIEHDQLSNPMNPVTVSSSERLLLLNQHISRNLTMVSNAVDQVTTRFNVDVDVSHKRGGPPVSVPAEHRTVVARVFFRDPNDLVDPKWKQLGSADLTPLTRTYEASNVSISAPNGLHPLGETPGPYLVSELSDTLGHVTFEFDVTNLTTGFEVFFNIEAIVEVDDADIATFNANLGGEPMLIPSPVRRGPWSMWSFPDTTEAGTGTQATF